MEKNAIIVTAFLNYDYEIRIKFLKAYLEKKGYKCLLLTSNYDHRNKCEYKPDHDGVNLISVPSYKKNLSFRRLYSHYVFAKKSKGFINKCNPQLVYAIIPPNFMASQIIVAKRDNCKVFFEVEDLWPESLPLPIGIKRLLWPFFLLWRSPRDRVLNKADYIIFECNLFKEYIAKKMVLKTNFKTIYLTKDNLIELTPYDYYCDILSYLYLGSVNNLIDIDLLLKILIESSKKKKVILNVIGKGERLKDLEEGCKFNDIIINLYGAIYDDNEKEKIFRESHFGLNIMKETVVVGATMKSLEYFYYGLPLLNNIIGDTSCIVEENNCGINLLRGDVTTAVNRVLEVVSNKQKYLAYRRNSRSVYERLFSPQAFYDSIDDVFQKVRL